MGSHTKMYTRSTRNWDELKKNALHKIKENILLYAKWCTIPSLDFDGNPKPITQEYIDENLIWIKRLFSRLNDIENLKETEINLPLFDGEELDEYGLETLYDYQQEESYEYQVVDGIFYVNVPNFPSLRSKYVGVLEDRIITSKIEGTSVYAVKEELFDSTEKFKEIIRKKDDTHYEHYWAGVYDTFKAQYPDSFVMSF